MIRYLYLPVPDNVLAQGHNIRRDMFDGLMW